MRPSGKMFNGIIWKIEWLYLAKSRAAAAKDAGAVLDGYLQNEEYEFASEAGY